MQMREARGIFAYFNPQCGSRLGTHSIQNPSLDTVWILELYLVQPHDTTLSQI